MPLVPMATGWRRRFSGGVGSLSQQSLALGTTFEAGYHRRGAICNANPAEESRLLATAAGDIIFVIHFPFSGELHSPPVQNPYSLSAAFLFSARKD
jgi:hypothetical protein